jgi:hypothetical protein
MAGEKTITGNEIKSEAPRLKYRTPIKFDFASADSNSIFSFDEELLSQHLMFVGSIGTGKTTAMIPAVRQIQKNMTDDDVMIVFDAKGDYYKELFRPGKDIVISNDDKAVGENNKVDYWNIHGEILRDENIQENITEIVTTLFQDKIEKTQQPFFPNAAKDLLFAILLFHCRTEEERKSATQVVNSSVVDLGEIIDEKDNRNFSLVGSIKTEFEKYGEELPEIKFYNSDIRTFLDEYRNESMLDLLSLYKDLEGMKVYLGDGTNNQALGVLAELQQVVREVFIGNFKKEGNLSIRDLVRKKGGRIVFIEYDLGIGSTLTPVYRLLFDLAMKEALCRTKSEGNVYFVADEFKLLPHLKHIDDAVNFGRSLGVKFIIGFQNVEQIYDAYGDKKARSLLSGFSTSVCFRLNDAESRKFIQGIHGTSRKKESFVLSGAGKGINESIREANVVEDWDISRLERGQAIIGLPGEEPFLFKFKKGE